MKRSLEVSKGNQDRLTNRRQRAMLSALCWGMFKVGRDAGGARQLNKRYSDELTLFHILCREGIARGVMWAIGAGADINAQTEVNRWTPLHFGVFYGYTRIVRELCAAGANPNMFSRFGAAPIHLAGRAKEIELLIAAGADVNLPARVPSRNSPLIIAIANGYEDAARTLIDAGADVNFQSHHFEASALHVACRYGSSLSLVHKLLNSGANPCLRDSYNLTPAEKAAFNGHDTLFWELDPLEHDPQQNALSP